MVYLPLWKIWVRQLGWWNSQYMEKQKGFQTTNRLLFLPLICLAPFPPLLNPNSSWYSFLIGYPAARATRATHCYALYNEVGRSTAGASKIGAESRAFNLGISTMSWEPIWLMVRPGSPKGARLFWQVKGWTFRWGLIQMFIAYTAVEFYLLESWIVEEWSIYSMDWFVRENLNRNP